MIGEATTIGAYRVLRKLGEGGMGTVYLAEHALLGRQAAIKVLLPALSSNQEIVQRFFNEARAVTQIADAGIVQVFDFGRHTDGSAFIVMELLEGEPVDHRLARIGRFSLIDTLRLIKMICRSLGAAHAKGIVHRDLKPENLFIVGDPAVTGGERPKILDFGIAKLSRDEPGALKTRTGMLMGTPVYMSPEQCRGAGDIDHRSDIYSIACVLVTMLTGRPPFAGEASGDLIVAHLREAPPLLASMVPGIPPALDHLVQRCLAKAPSDRFASMIEVVAALDAVEAALYHAGVVLEPAASGAMSGAHSAARPQWATGVGSGLRTPTTTLSSANGHTLATRPARSPALLVALIASAIIVGGAITGGVGYYATRDRGAAAPAAALPLPPPLAPVAIAPVPPPSPPPPPPQAASAPPEPAAVDAGVDAEADAIGRDAAPPVPAHKLAKPHRKPSSGRATEHATTTEPAAPPVIDRGD